MPSTTVNDAALLDSFPDSVKTLLVAPPNPDKYMDEKIELQPEWVKLRLQQHKREVSNKVDQVRQAESNVLKTMEQDHIAKSFRINCKLIAKDDIMDLQEVKENCAALEAYCTELGQELTRKFLTKHLKFILAYHRRALITSIAVAALDIATGTAKHILATSNSNNSLTVTPVFEDETTATLLAEFAMLTAMEELKNTFFR